MSKFTPVDIPGFPGYAATPDGHVFSLSSNWRGRGVRELAQTINSDGYPSVRIMVNGKRKHIGVHRLIAVTFLGQKPFPSYQIRHLDGTRINNNYSNLKWGSAKENASDRDAHGRTYLGKKNEKLCENQVKEIRKMLNCGYTQRRVASNFEVSQSTIGAIKRGVTWKNVK